LGHKLAPIAYLMAVMNALNKIFEGALEKGVNCFSRPT
jgi:hypothetical protein